MPILGYAGYLPFGLEVFTMVNFVLPLVGLGTMTFDPDETAGDYVESERRPRVSRSGARASS
jgi:hypothetical protein